MRRSYIVLIIFIVATASCAKKADKNKVSNRSEQLQESLAKKIAELPREDINDEIFIEEESGAALGAKSRNYLIEKSREKRLDQSIFRTNERIIKANRGHSKIYPFIGKYRVMVIPVQFSDVKFKDKSFFKANADGLSLASDYIFGDNKNSMTSYYKHASMGNFKLEGEVTPIITVDRTLKNYGEATAGRSDKHANGLVIDALKKLKQIRTDENWWFKFDTWDLSDYDKDSNFNEPDGFLDAVVLIYAGKSQASCQAAFDKDGTRPASAEVPAGPRKAASVECFNRIWPHRWSVNMSNSDPEYTTKGPIVEGRQRPAMNGLKINNNLFAIDYNMQSEFSDRSTFIHEFGHSLSLPDIYSGGKANSTGGWDVMSSNANLQAQEMSSYSKISLGWLSPKIVEQGEDTSAYLGAYNFVAEKQREDLVNYQGPNLSVDDESILSTVPDSGENVYRSIMVITDETEEKKKIIDTIESVGSTSAYSSKFDGKVKTLDFKVNVPIEGNALISFDTIYHIETETNFDSKEEKIKVITDFDLGEVVINGEVVEELRLVSGDKNYNTLNESNPRCNESLVLKMRSKLIKGLLSPNEKVNFDKKVAVCQKPLWTNKSYDLSKFRGKNVDFEIKYTTDSGYTEFGIVVDNIKMPDGKTVDFENSRDTGEFTALVDGSETLSYSQYYLMEHRLPQASYKSNNKVVSYNMDRNISVGSQSMFLSEGSSVADKFRMVTFDYQPGVLVWYFNSKYGRNSAFNTPVKNKGKGYLLVLNSKVEELTLPGIFSDENLKDGNGDYPKIDLDDGIAGDLETLVDLQRREYVCFGYTVYASYQTGREPDCSGDFVNYMQGLKFEGKSLVYRRERFNQLLPNDRYATHGVGRPFRSGTTMRTGLSTFRPIESKPFSPFRVYKEENGEMVLDKKLTAESVKILPISTFNDADNSLDLNSSFHGDSVVVEKKGFNFEVVTPSPQVIQKYLDHDKPEENTNFLRAPKTKIYFSWK